MPLTTELRNPNSPMSQLLATRLPGLPAYALQDIMADLGPIAVPSPWRVPGPAAEVGTAFDYALRLQHLGLNLTDPTQPHQQGLRVLEHSGTNGIEDHPGTRLQTKAFVHTTRYWLYELQNLELIQREEADTKQTHILYTMAVLAAWLDQAYRRGRWPDKLKTLALAIPENRAWGQNMLAEPEMGAPLLHYRDIAAQVPPAQVRDLENLMHAAENPFSESFSGLDELLRTKRTVIGPTFQGSKDVGNADADFIHYGMLCDVKTTKAPQREWHNCLRQLLGYSILDYADKYEISSLSVYFARWGSFLTRSLEEVIEATRQSPDVTMASLRQEFMAAVMRNR